MASRSAVPPSRSRTDRRSAQARERVRISVRGVVQGVGFRPFVYQLANRLKLAGWVRNTSEDVRIEVQGSPKAVRQFLRSLRDEAPPRATIEDMTVTRLGTPSRATGFEIRNSLAEEGKYQLVSPDIATCGACLGEILSPDDRRFHYPFTNCTNCGPRFTIIEDIPYDRPRTTMRNFTMCPDCQREYDDALNRRFHAQPNACPTCGPRLELLDATGKPVATGDVIADTARLLREGRVVAIKGLGGFLLACDATNDAAVSLLRDRKKRPAKPFAIMVTSLEEARRHCLVNEAEAKLLASPAAPIVLLPWRKESAVSPAVAPGLRHLGIMLPYTPLHHLLMREAGRPLVMTSGNLSEEPITKDNDEALARLAGIADYYVVHNRDIYARYDDSVAIVERSVPQLVRRARGYAPYPVRLPFKGRRVLACGAEEKSTFCLTRDEYAFVSQHIGDLENLETLEYFSETIALYKRLFRVEPELIAHDMHPDYLSTQLVKEMIAGTTARLVPVQHHHAHIASGMADNGLDSPVIGVAFDGTGYGTDGHVWGGEFLVADYHGFKRLGQLEYLPLAGGARAIKKPYRTAIGYLLTLLGETALNVDLPVLTRVGDAEIGVIRQQIAKGLNSPLTSSCGRLFDAVSALIGVRGEISYDAQAAVELEVVAIDAPDESGTYPFSIEETGGLSVIRVAELFVALLADLRSRVPPRLMAARFHNTVARMIAERCMGLAAETGLDRVGLSGGVFQNRLLLRKTMPLLEATGLIVYTHRQVPTNDGGVSLGQAVIAGKKIKDR